jgi:predicted DNA-binding transcriptional regulator AlpA
MNPLENGNRFVRMRELVTLVGLSKTEIYRRIQQERFPRGRKLTPRITVWCFDELNRWAITQLDPELADLL